VVNVTNGAHIDMRLGTIKYFCHDIVVRCDEMSLHERFLKDFLPQQKKLINVDNCTLTNTSSEIKIPHYAIQETSYQIVKNSQEGLRDMAAMVRRYL
jgi:hypothetical protein